MKGRWYGLRGDRPAHWHEYVDRPDGTGFWAALSRCGMQKVVPSVLADIDAWHGRYPDAPEMDGRWRCRPCERNRALDVARRRAQEDGAGI